VIWDAVIIFYFERWLPMIPDPDPNKKLTKEERREKAKRLKNYKRTEEIFKKLEEDFLTRHVSIFLP
jgi:hypothetical protein